MENFTMQKYKYVLVSFLSSLQLNNEIRRAGSKSPTSRFEQFLLYKLN